MQFSKVQLKSESNLDSTFFNSGEPIFKRDFFFSIKIADFVKCLPFFSGLGWKSVRCIDLSDMFRHKQSTPFLLML